MTYARYLLATSAAVLAASFLLASAGPTAAQENAPEIVYQNINDGDTLGEKPYVLQMCFADPINVEDLDKGGDFRFALTTPQNQGLGLRIVFQPDGYGVAVYPGLEPEPVPGIATPTGEPGWRYEYRVTNKDDLTPLEGVVNFAVDEDAEPILMATPPACVAQGGTATPGEETPPADNGSPTSRPTRTPVGGTTEPGEDTPAPGETEEPEDDDDDTNGTTEEDDDDDDSDVLLLALLTIGIVGALAGLALIGYMIRRRVGFDPHKPGPTGGAPH